jgi:flavin reductase (DIM6/NTAB) family NADH-FMN oxidoreductase RutF
MSITVSRQTEQLHLDPAIFRNMFGGFPSGVTVVTAASEDGVPVGLTVSAVMSVSLDPPLLAVCLQNAKFTLDVIQSQGLFAVNFLASHQAAVSTNFARGEHDKFAAVDWISSERARVPILHDVRAHAECRVESVIPAGDHTLIIGRIVAGSVNEKVPLAYCSRQYLNLEALLTTPAH